ncbi:hypothetical protein, partial [Neisseria sp. 83E34]|uniref:hypothetical protein n=1 Tax=Neisseria sp. 83E34 TaxID=1692264 RepID=UPI0006DB7755
FILKLLSTLQTANLRHSVTKKHIGYSPQKLNLLFTFCHIELWANPYRLSENTTTIKISSLPNFISPYKIQYLNLKSSNNYAKFLFFIYSKLFQLIKSAAQQIKQPYNRIPLQNKMPV